jgi:hypothetical protein
MKTMSKEKNIYQKLNVVRQKVSYLQKDTQVQGYKAITHDAVTSAVREPFIEEGIMLIPNQVESNVENVGKTSNGTLIIRYEATYEVAFLNIENPEDKIVVRIESHANDHGDKAPGKAISYAVKYAMLKVLNIETGESEESRVEVAQAKKPDLIPDTERWNKAVEALSNGDCDIDFIIDKYDISTKHVVKIQKDAGIA